MAIESKKTKKYRMPKLPEDFDPDEYLRLHEDVAAANIDPEKHYLTYGITEGRPYKEHMTLGAVEKLETVVITNPALLRERLGKETLLVTGSERGATSLVAYALLRLGYPMRADATPNHELNELVGSVGKPDEIIKIFARENRKQERWGFKLPSALQCLDWYVDNMRTPVVLVICRNPLAIYRSIDRHDKDWEAGQLGLRRGLRHALTYLNAAQQAVDCDAPVVFLDIDLAQRKPEVFIREIATLFGLPFNEDVVREISEPGYKPIPDKNQ